MARTSSVRKITWFGRVTYAVCREIVRLYFQILYSTRYFGQANIPASGGVLIVSNHQSHYDPPLIGCGIFRRINYLARKTLFKFKPFAWLIDSFDAIPLDNEGIGYEGIKETIKRLKNGEMVLMFPEGARSWDGKIVPFKSGFLTLA
ncbi:MAG: lysophospholipid acyltransferase family protein, partial [Thermoguttaceae bacterium]